VPAVRRALAEAEEHRARKQAEEELVKAYRTMEERVKIRTAELEAEMAVRKKMEEALQESEERYRALFEQANDAIFVTDPAGPGRVLSANPAACRMFGYSAEEFVGLDRQSHLDTNDPKLSEMLRHREGQGTAVGEVSCRRKDGAIFPAEFATALFTDRIGQRRSVAIVRDITERKQAEAALRETYEWAEWLARFSEENPNPVMRVSADGSVLYCNPASMQIPGWASKEGRNFLSPFCPSS
jgi:PAS domain S-box-containing protein